MHMNNCYFLDYYFLIIIHSNVDDLSVGSQSFNALFFLLKEKRKKRQIIWIFFTSRFSRVGRYAIGGLLWTSEALIKLMRQKMGIK